MTIADCKPGDIIETRMLGILTGNIYKLSLYFYLTDGRIAAYKFGGGSVGLHPNVSCQVLTKFQGEF